MSAADEDAPGLAEKIAASGPLSDADEIMFRQVHPILYQAGAVASSVFMPTEDDQDQMSVDRGSLTTPKASFDLYRENVGSPLRSTGSALESSPPRASLASRTLFRRRKT